MERKINLEKRLAETLELEQNKARARTRALIMIYLRRTLDKLEMSDAEKTRFWKAYSETERYLSEAVIAAANANNGEGEISFSDARKIKAGREILEELRETLLMTK